MFDIRSAKRSGVLAIVLIVAVVGCVVASSPSEAASSSTVVGASISSATWMEPGSCPGGVAGSTSFPLLTVAQSIATTDDCTVGFGSSNDTSSLFVHQADQHGAVMFRHSHGPIDPSYGTAGTGWVPSGSGEAANSIAIQADGKSVVVGQSGGSELRVARFTVDGVPDASFGVDGVVSIDIAPGVDDGHDIVVDQDGTILVSGTEFSGGTRRQFVVRLDQDGESVTSFGTDGIAFVDNPANGDRNYAIELMDDRRIVLGGDVCCYRFTAARLHPDGSLDHSFGGDGMVEVKFPNYAGLPVDSDSASDVSINAAGEIALVGAVRQPTIGWYLAVARLHQDGTLNTSFSADGMLVEPNQSGAASVVLYDDERMAILGSSSILRLLPDGSMDPTFNGGAMLAVLPTNNMAVDSLGRYITTGAGRVARINFDGSMDTTFNGTGTRSLGLAGTALYAITEATDGRIMVAGSTVESGVQRYATVRLDSTTIAGYQSGTADFTPGSSTFGGCVRALDPGPGATFITGWAPAGDCTASNAAYWNEIPARAADASRIATLDQDGTTGHVQLRFGMRTLPNQPAGQYLAPITFHVVAPAVS